MKAMNFQTIKEKSLADQQWLERALLVLDANKLWRDDDQKDGSYMASWVRNQLERKVKLGHCLTSDYWCGRARAVVQKYAKELLQVAYEKAKADASLYAEKAKAARKRAKQLEKEISQIVEQELKASELPA